MTAAHAWHLFTTLPIVVKAWLAALLLVLGFGIWTVSKTAAAVLVGATALAATFVQPLRERSRRRDLARVTGHRPPGSEHDWIDDPAMKRDLCTFALIVRATQVRESVAHGMQRDPDGELHGPGDAEADHGR